MLYDVLHDCACAVLTLMLMQGMPMPDVADDAFPKRAVMEAASSSIAIKTTEELISS